jgi:hypothetical protein
MKPFGITFLKLVSMACVMASPDKGADSTLQLVVPKEVAADASRRAAGDMKAASPILVLEGMEWTGNSLRIKVLGPSTPGSEEPAAVLAVTGLVGTRGDGADNAPQKMDLVIPLNAKGSQILAGRTKVTLTLRLDNGQGQSSLKLERAYFRIYGDR